MTTYVLLTFSVFIRYILPTIELYLNGLVDLIVFLFYGGSQYVDLGLATRIAWWEFFSEPRR